MRAKYAMITAVAFAMSVLLSCSKENIGVVSAGQEADRTGIHFIQSGLTKTFPMGSLEGVMELVLARNSDVGRYCVILAVKGGDEKLFSVRDSVIFEDGMYSVSVPVKVSLEKIVPGSSVSTTIYIRERDAYLDDDASYITQFTDKIDLKASFELAWEPYMRTSESGEKVQQTASYYYNLFYVGSQGNMIVERAVGATNIFRVLDWAAGAPLVFKMNSDHTIVVPAQSTGYFYASAGEEVYASDIAEYTGDPAAYGAYPCYYDGTSTFVLNLVYYVSDGVFNYGTEYLVFATNHDNDPTVVVGYDGNGEFSFEFGEYTSSCRVLVVEGDRTQSSSSVNEIRKSILDGTADGLRTYHSSATDTWSLSEGSNSVFAIPFDSEGKAGEMVYRRFTYDPFETIMPKVAECTFESSPDDPYHIVECHLKTINAAAIQYQMLETEVVEYYMDNGYSLEELIGYGDTIGSKGIEAANKDGITFTFSDLGEGSQYALLIGIKNKLGDMVAEQYRFSPMSHFETFDQNRTIDDFVGNFIADVQVTIYEGDEGTTTQESFLVNFAKTTEGKILIQGLSDIHGYSPILEAEYVKEEHLIRLPTQRCNSFDGKNVMFAYGNAIIDSMWGDGYTADFGFGSDGRLYLKASPSMVYPVNGYKFAFANEEGGSTGEFIEGKAYQFISLRKITMTP